MSAKKPSSDQGSILTNTSLQGYFLDQLEEINKKSAVKLPQEALIYSSMVMDRFAEASEYFDVVEGKTREKILGTKLLESGMMDKENKKRTLKEIGDTSLCLCGFFSDSLNKKIVDTRYYRDLGRMAYERLNSIVPDFYDIPSFFKIIAESLQNIIMMMNFVAQKHFSQDFMPEPCLIINNPYKIKAS